METSNAKTFTFFTNRALRVVPSINRAANPSFLFQGREMFQQTRQMMREG